MPPKFKRHLNDDDVTGSVKSERRNLLEDDSDEEEDFFLRGPSGPRFGPRNDKIKHVQNQVDEVIDVMQENITKKVYRIMQPLSATDPSNSEGKCGGEDANFSSAILTDSDSVNSVDHCSIKYAVDDSVQQLNKDHLK
ncbi:vesicle-associated membrane protein 4 isoform X1 [Sigmodon hispidus]